jgi:tRNA/rRNA methyltransferase
MKIQFILVEPKVPDNVGASARAIKTMGFDKLLLVNPCRWKEGKSKWIAHGSADILESASTYDSLEAALENSDYAIATSARQRSVKQDYVPASELYDFIVSKYRSAENISVVFGREESGLTNEEMKLCDITSNIPIVKPFPSLNLSQAVMLYAYELSGFHTIKSPETVNSDQASFRKLKIKIRDILMNLGITEDDNRFGRIMERIAFLGDDDINLFHSVTSILDKRIREFNTR